MAQWMHHVSDGRSKNNKKVFAEILYRINQLRYALMFRHTFHLVIG